MFPEKDFKDFSIVIILCTCSVLTRFDVREFVCSMVGATQCFGGGGLSRFCRQGCLK